MISPDGVADLARRLDDAAVFSSPATPTHVWIPRTFLYEAANTLSDMAVALREMTKPVHLRSIVKETAILNEWQEP